VQRVLGVLQRGPQCDVRLLGSAHAHIYITWDPAAVLTESELELPAPIATQAAELVNHEIMSVSAYNCPAGFRRPEATQRGACLRPHAHIWRDMPAETLASIANEYPGHSVGTNHCWRARIPSCH
jgi:hypothetical protein